MDPIAQEIETGLKEGRLYFDVLGNRLETVDAILLALRRFGQVLAAPPTSRRDTVVDSGFAIPLAPPPPPFVVPSIDEESIGCVSTDPADDPWAVGGRPASIDPAAAAAAAEEVDTDDLPDPT